MLAGVVVGNNLDEVNGNTTTIAALVANTGGDGISLREAVLAANATAGADVITFAAPLSGQTITLGGAELVITEAITIDARALAANVTIDADFQSRIINVTAATGDFTLGGLTITGGRIAGGALETLGVDGGAIQSKTTGTLTLDQCSVLGNSAVGQYSRGGAVNAMGAVTLLQSTVTGNVLIANGTDPRPDYYTGGAGVFASGDVSLIESKVSGNTLVGNRLFHDILLDLGGGGIHARGDVTLINSTVSGNRTFGLDGRGGGILADNVTLTNSVVSRNNTAGDFADGGGIASRRLVTVTKSTVSGNSTAGKRALGGGIFSLLDDVTLTNSTVSGNSTVGTSAGGGGIYAGGDLVIGQSTISGNSVSYAHGGGIYVDGSVTITQSTITGNRAPAPGAVGGGIYQRDSNHNRPIAISNSIVAGNTTAAAGSDLFADSQSLLTANYSVIGTGITGNGVGNVVTNNPRLGPLANNGGPTSTHALLSGSPAIDAGDPNIAFNPAQFDQRDTSFVRVVGGRIDIGAYERQPLNFVVDVTSDASDGDYSPGHLSLREAIGLANVDTGADLITFAAALNGQTINLALGELLISDPLTINGPGANLLTIRAFDPTPQTKNGDGSRIFKVDNGAATVSTVVISGLTLTGGDVAGHGGAVFNREFLSIASSTISGNNAGGSFGGGLYNGGASAVLALNGVTVSNNLAAFGGGIMNISGLLVVAKSTISGNAVSGNGGGIQNNNGSIDIITSTISGNNGAGAGGGILTYYDLSTSLANVTISGNSATQGGGLWARASHVNVAFSTITGNSAGGTGVGGGVRLIYPVGTTLNHAIVAGNIGASTPRDDIAGAVTARFSLIGDSTGAVITNNGGNLIGTGAAPINPLLGSLTNNGGSTQTHALLAGSPAIDAGDPSVAFNPAQFDQRGAPYVRVFDGAAPVGARIDVGAVELQPVAPSADFDADADVDGSDFLIWQRGFGATGAAATRANGNSDNDGDVDGADFAVWKGAFGSPDASSAQEQALAIERPTSMLHPEAVDAALTYHQMLADAAPRRPFRPRLPRGR